VPRHPSERGQPPEPGLLILMSLYEGPKHGYAMIEDIAQIARVRLGPGTLYGALARLEARGLIEPLPDEERRRPYRLTGLGLEVLREQLASFQQIAEAGLRRLSAV
jgi:DNA-binding PadR family transcriptional regulator